MEGGKVGSGSREITSKIIVPATYSDNSVARSSGSQVMFCAGSLMSQVLQWTQFWELIWNTGLPTSSQRLVDAGGTVALRQLGVAGQVLPKWQSGSASCGCAGLVLFVVGVGEVDRAELSKLILPSGFGYSIGVQSAAGLSTDNQLFVVQGPVAACP